MDPRIVALTDILKLNTRLFRNCLDGMTDDQAAVRPSGVTNSAAFVAAHLADARFLLLRILCAEQANPLADSVKGAHGIDDLSQWPPVADVLAAWTTASHTLRDRLDVITPADLEAPAKPAFPWDGATVLEALTFLVQHDSHHIGQLALLRKHAGLPAMRYR